MKGVFACCSTFLSQFCLSPDLSSTEAKFPGGFSLPDTQTRAGTISPTLLLFLHYFGHEGVRKGTGEDVQSAGAQQ